MAQNDVYQLNAVQVSQDVALANIFFVRVDNDDTSVVQPDNAISMFISAVIFPLRSVQGNWVNHDCVIGRKVFPTTEIATIQSVGLSGQLPGSALPINNCAVAQHSSLPARKENRGHWFISGAAQDSQNKERWTEAYQALFSTFITSVTNPATESGVNYTFVHYSPRLETYEPIKTVRIAGQVRKLRQRTPARCPTL